MLITHQKCHSSNKIIIKVDNIVDMNCIRWLAQGHSCSHGSLTFQFKTLSEITILLLKKVLDVFTSMRLEKHSLVFGKITCIGHKLCVIKTEPLSFHKKIDKLATFLNQYVVFTHHFCPFFNVEPLLLLME